MEALALVTANEVPWTCLRTSAFDCSLFLTAFVDFAVAALACRTTPAALCVLSGFPICFAALHSADDLVHGAPRYPLVDFFYDLKPHTIAA